VGRATDAARSSLYRPYGGPVSGGDGAPAGATGVPGPTAADDPAGPQAAAPAFGVA